MEQDMRSLVDQLNTAADSYYNSGIELISNKEYDELYDKLVLMEKQSNTHLFDSPTQRVGYVTKVDGLKKVRHEFPALSLAKTKDISEFPKIFNVRNKMATVMWKCDGSTVVATYDKNHLTCLATRGNGEIGQDITHNAPFIKGLPLTIPYSGKMICRGEAVMTYKEFNRVNAELPAEEQYKNPRNLANATISMLDSSEMRKREIWFEGFKLVYVERGSTPLSGFSGGLAFMLDNGMNVVEYRTAPVSSGYDDDLITVMNDFTNRVSECPYPVDGLVVAADDVDFASQQPGTAHNPSPLVGYALKWKDDTVETTLRAIEWSASRTGLLNPVAVFDPVELEGTTVTRASLHNVSYIMEKNLLLEDRITVFKANKIIPQVAENLDANKHGPIDPTWLCHRCPVCGQLTVLETSKDGSTVCKCVNPDCAAKHIGKFVHFAERDCMNIVGMSEQTVTKLVEAGYLKYFSDFYNLYLHKEDMEKWEGFGKKAIENLLSAIEASRKTSFVPFIHALGIPNVGLGQSKLLSKHFGGDIHKFLKCEGWDYDFTQIEGFGDVINKSLQDWFAAEIKPGWDTETFNLLNELTFTAPVTTVESTLTGKTFVITGSVEHFENRDALKEFIESKGGKTSGSVSKNTTFLINNDVTSTSGKNQKAKTLNIPIISEEDFLKMV